MGIVFVQWVLFGFSFAFGPPVSRGFGSFGDACLTFNQRMDEFYSPTYPLLTYAAYQGTFAIITAALISGLISIEFCLFIYFVFIFEGAVVGRMKIIPYMIFIFVWTTVCYDPLAHWVWSENGWLKYLGTLDFAGGTVVHISSGVSGFVASLVLGKRLDYHKKKNTAHNLPFTVLGASLLWVGWIGFNAGSANAAKSVISFFSLIKKKRKILFSLVVQLHWP
jgi:Amt family ammonium transporter